MGGDGVPMPRFFVDKSNVTADSVNITGDDVNHIKRVLRLRLGEIITVNDLDGTDYQVKLESFDEESIYGSIISSCPNTTESMLDITLFQGLPKSDKMDLIIQKSVELGVKKIVPVLTERTIVKISGEKDARNKVVRWQRIALEAAKQCNRGFIPQVVAPVDFDEALKMAAEAELGIIPYEKEEEARMKSHLKSGIRTVAVMIGPEGGFSEGEVQRAIDAGIKPVTLGPRILRTETAGIVALSIIGYEIGDI